MIIRAKAPLRISFGGGGTDVSPYCDERGGVVLSATIDKFAYGSLIPNDKLSSSITSLDYDIVAKYHTEKDLIYNGELDLVKSVLKTINKEARGVDLFLHSDAPPGSGLGSSSTMMVTLLGLFKHWKRLPMTNYEIAEFAYKIERMDLGIKGGKQDQYAAVFGGFNFIEFKKNATIVNPLRINKEVLNELQYRLLLCYTGKTRLGGDILKKQVDGYVAKNEPVVEALDETKKIAIEMKSALLLGNIDELGELMNIAWGLKKNFTNSITNPEIDRLYDIAMGHGAVGGKLLGAGGGGYILFLCKFDKKHIVARELEAHGGQVVEFGFDNKGLQTWSVTGLF